jgi:putative photosynthetic complex assembly protein
MSETKQHFPRKVLIAATALLVFTITAAFAARVTGVGASTEREAAAREVRELRFDDRDDGAVVIREASNGQLVEVLEPGTSGFVRIVMRVLARERKLNDQGREVPFRLVRWTDGRLSIEDPTTRRRIDLGAFGAVNTAAFAQLLPAGGTTQ